MKKSIFAVLAVFLAAALLVGAGSAATVIYPYTDTGLENQALYFVNDPTKIIVPINGVIATDDFTPGIYKLVSAAPADLRDQLDVILATLPDDITVKGHSVNKADTGVFSGEFFLTQPDAKIVIEMIGPDGAIAGSNAVGKTVPSTIGLDFIVTPLRAEDTDFASLWFTTPAGGKTSYLGFANSEYPFGDGIFGEWIAANVFEVDTLAEADVPAGQWNVQLKYNSIANVAPGYEAYIDTISATKYPFKIATSVNNLEVSKDVVIRGQSFLVTLTGIPGTDVILTIDPNNLDILPGQAGYDYSNGIVTLNSEGKRTIQINTDSRLDEDKYTIKATFLFDMDVQQAKVSVIKGGIDISAGQESYYLGNEVTFHGNNTETDTVFLYIKGANKPLQVISLLGGGNVNGAIQTETGLLQGNGGIIVNIDGTWTSKKYTLANEFDAGTYTVFALTEPLTFTANSGIGESIYTGLPFLTRYVNEAQIDAQDLSYSTCSLRLIQPFIDAKATPVVARGDSVIVSGHVEGQPSQLLWYVFGQNYFQWGTVTPDTNGDFSKKVSTAGLSTGQYFVVVQHPMYDKEFNVQPLDYKFSEYDLAFAYFNMYVMQGEDPEDPATWLAAEIAAELTYPDLYEKYYNDIYSFATDVNGNIQDDRSEFLLASLVYGYVADAKFWDPRDVISSVNTRQTANAAKAVCDLIDEEYVDDIYFKGDFIVETPYIILNNVADQTQGSTFTISGTTNVADGAIVTVEVISTKFQAESKVKVSEASYLTQAVKVQAGEKAGVNVWSATFDSTPLVVDSYSAKAEISARDVSAVDSFLLTKGAEQPTATAQPTGPAQPTATAQPTPTSTPGFGALIALAGLGAVAVLVLRRQ